MLIEIDDDKIDVSIEMIRTYVTEVDVEPVIDVLEAIKKDPNNTSLMDRLSESLQLLGIAQGAVLTYAPYVALLVSDDLFDDE